MSGNASHKYSEGLLPMYSLYILTRPQLHPVCQRTGLQSAGNSRVHVDFCEVFVAKFLQCPEVSFLGWPIWIKKWQQKLQQWDFGMTRNAASHHAGVPSFAAFELGGRNLERAFPRKAATGAKWSFSRLRCANFIDAGVRRSGPQFFRGDLR